MRTSNGWDRHVWMRPSSVRALGKLLARKCRLEYPVTLDIVVRACGFVDFKDALENPRQVLVPLDTWVQRLEDALDVNLERMFGFKELRILYYKVFTDSRPISLSTWVNQMQPAIPRARPATDWAPEDDFIPARVSHEQTVVDEIVRQRNPPRRVVRRE
jgi:hypothetical protein